MTGAVSSRSAFVLEGVMTKEGIAMAAEAVARLNDKNDHLDGRLDADATAAAWPPV